MGTSSLPGRATLWLLCRAGEHKFALPAEHVVEVMRLLPVRTIAEAPPILLGTAVIRGRAVPVVDIGLLLGEAPVSARYLVAVRVGERKVALAVEEIVGVRDLAQTGAELPPLLDAAAGKAIEAIEVLDSEWLLRLRAARLLPDSVLHLAIEGAA
jgi:purine-binding chemotaxis protein CheW